MRTVIVGGPRAGKTTLADRLGGTVIHTDDAVADDWSQRSAMLSHTLGTPGDWTMEGCAAVRALRKALAARPHEKPCDHVMWLTPKIPLTPKQEAFRKGCETVFRAVEPHLVRLGVLIDRA